MVVALFLQQQTPVTLESGWVGPVIAISLLIIASGALMAGIALLLVLREIKEQTVKISTTIDTAQAAMQRIGQQLRDASSEGRHILHLVRHETEAFAKTSRKIRRKVMRGSKRVEQRLEDLDALYEVVYDEVADTALTAASTVHTIRTGGKWVRRIKRFFPRSRRRK